jgi:hypothetical protein
MTKVLEPMTTYHFLAGLDAFSREDWNELEAACRKTLEHLEEWDSAWGLLVGLHLDREAQPAMAIARTAGAGLRVQALAGAACAAVAARGQLGERRFNSLYAPFASLLPAEEPEPSQAHSFPGWFVAACPLKAVWR